MTFLQTLRRFFHGVPRSVTFDNEKVLRTMKDGDTEVVYWDDLYAVEIITTNDGPWSEDVFFILKGETGGCAVPQGVLGADKLLLRLQELPGFRNDVVIEAMAATSNAVFVCWQRD